MCLRSVVLPLPCTSVSLLEQINGCNMVNIPEIPIAVSQASVLSWVFAQWVWVHDTRLTLFRSQ
jgi:hypothetical protein